MLISSLETLLDITGAILPITNEVLISFQNGISIIAVDPSNVVFVDMTVKKDAFKEFKFDAGGIALDLAKLNDKLSVGKKGSDVEVSYDQPNQKLVLKLGNMKYSIALIDPSAVNDLPRLPVMTFTGTKSIGGEEFASIVKAAMKTGEEGNLSIEGNDFVIRSGSMLDSFEYKIDGGKGEANSRFGLGYFDSLANTFKKADNIKMEMGVNYPVKMTLSIGKMDVTYLFAPRIEGLEGDE